VSTGEWNNGGERTGAGANVNAVATLQSGWILFGSVGRGFSGLTAVPTHGGPAVLQTPSRFASLSASSDERRALAVGANASRYLTDAGTTDASAGLSATWRPSATVELRAGPSYERSRTIGYLVATVPDSTATATYGARYVFGPLEQTTLAASLRANVTFTPSLSLQLYAEPFTSGARSVDLRELRRARSAEIVSYRDDPSAHVVRLASGDYRVTRTQAGGVVRTFDVPDPDARYRSLRGSAVLRWEYRPGATLFVVWQHVRSDYETGARYGGVADLRSLFGLPPQNVLLLKANYWWSR
jgi:hypothetical protein